MSFPSRNLYCYHVGLMSCDLDSNAPDFASRAKTPGAALWPQLFSVPLSFSVVSFIGIIVSSSSQAIYGEAIWSPIDLLGRFLDDSPSSATRFGVCFFSVFGTAVMNFLIVFLIVSSVGLVHFLCIYHCTGNSFPFGRALCLFTSFS
jgi:cytosine/uracil/thiamine/allantoin permease